MGKNKKKTQQAGAKGRGAVPPPVEAKPGAEPESDTREEPVVGQHSASGDVIVVEESEPVAVQVSSEDAAVDEEDVPTTEEASRVEPSEGRTASPKPEQPQDLFGPTSTDGEAEDVFVHLARETEPAVPESLGQEHTVSVDADGTDAQLPTEADGLASAVRADEAGGDDGPDTAPVDVLPTNDADKEDEIPTQITQEHEHPVREQEHIVDEHHQPEEHPPPSEQPFLTKDTNHEIDLFASASPVDADQAESVFQPKAAPVDFVRSEELQKEGISHEAVEPEVKQSETQESETQEPEKQKPNLEEPDTADLFAGLSEADARVHEFQVVVGHLHAHDHRDPPSGDEGHPKPTPNADADAAVEDGPAEGQGEADEAFAGGREEGSLFGGGEGEVGDELFAATVEAQEPESEPDLFGAPEGKEEPDLFGTGPTDLDFINTPPAPPAAAQPTKQRVEDMDLDAAGVPQGWVDEQGGWNWYTVEERLDVARGMFGVEASQEGDAVPLDDGAGYTPDPYAPATASDSYSPQQAYAPPATQSYSPYSPATAQIGATNDPYKPAASPNAYVPAGQSSVYPYQRQPSATHPHVQVEPPSRSFSPYDPPVSSISKANVFKPAAPVITAASPYTPAPVTAAPARTAPPPALSRMKTSTAYDPPMIPVTKALARPASAAPVTTPFAAVGFPSPGLGMTGMAAPNHVPPGMTSPPPPPPTGPPRGSSRVSSPANVVHPPARKQQVTSAISHPATPNAYDPPTVPVMPNRPASRVATPVMTGLGVPHSAAGAMGVQPKVVLPPPPKSVPGLAAPPRAPSSLRQPPPHRQPVESAPELPKIQPPAQYSPAGMAHSLPSQYAPPHTEHVAHPAPPRLTSPPAHPPHAAAPLTYGLPATSYQAPPFARPSSGMKGVLERPPSRNPSPAPYPNENQARMSDDQMGTEVGAKEEEETRQQEASHLDEIDADPEGGLFEAEEDDAGFEYSVQSSRSRPTLQQDTFAPPSPPAPKGNPLHLQEASPYDPYAPKPHVPVSAPAYTPVTANVPIRPATAPYADLAADPYAPHASQPSHSYMPVPSFQPPMSHTVPATPAAQTSPMPAEPYGHSPGKPPSLSAYDPVDASARHNMEEDHLARSSPAARRVPSVSFGPNGTLVVAFQRDPDEDISLQSTSLAYGDDSKGLPVHIRRLADALPPPAEQSGSTQWPGPLLTDPQASKTSAAERKKRDALNAFLTERIQEIESGLPYLSASGKDVVTRANQEATMLLYQVAQLMLKHDGKTLTSDPAAHAELKALLPKLSQTLDTTKSTATNNVNGMGTTEDTHYLSEFLLKGDQQAALQYAMEHQLWSHALLLAAGIDPATWTTTVSAFVKATVQSEGANGSQAVLATAYSIYGQGGPAVVESIPNGDLPGIWRNSLATIIASSKPNDATYVIALAEKLQKQGLVKAAHLCYVLSPLMVAWQHSRPDSPVSLIGSSETDQQTEATLMSEILEYAIWLRPVSKGAEAFYGVPGLLQYKLNKAATLFATGDAALAKRYCEAVIASLRLRKVPDQASQRIKLQLQNLFSRINGEEFNVSSAKGLPKPKLENLGSWFEGTLTKFIAGEEVQVADSKSVGHAKKPSLGSAGIGPFSHFSAITPEATPALPSRAMSSFDIPSTSFPPPIARSGSAMSYRPQQAAVQPIIQQRPTSAMAYQSQEHRLSALSQVSSRPADESTGYGLAAEPAQPSNTTHVGATPSSDNYEKVEQEHAVEIPTWGQSYTFDETEQNGAESAGETEGSFINPMANFITPAASLHPSAASTPPAAYQPQMTRRDDFEEDDDDLGLGNSSHKKKQPSPDTAPKVAPPTSKYAPTPQQNPGVESTTEEPEKPKESPKPAQGGSWLGRLWGKGASEAPAQTTGPVRAKLGNESSMYYDKELKRWVTKGPGGQPEAPKATPPPPRAAPTPSPATASTVPSPHPSVPPASRPASAAPPAMTVGGPTRSLAATPALAGIATPPLRPASTATVGDSPIGNALAPPPGRRAGTAGKKSIRSRYVEIT